MKKIFISMIIFIVVASSYNFNTVIAASINNEAKTNNVNKEEKNEIQLTSNEIEDVEAEKDDKEQENISKDIETTGNETEKMSA